MIDDYMHLDCTVMYVDENIPGTVDNTDEYKNLVTNFNSQLIDHCKCEAKCDKKTCKCLLKSGGANYEFRTEGQSQSLLLNLEKYTVGNSISYPFIECNSLCTCSEHCGNRVVQKGPVNCLFVETCAVSPKGKGLFTTQLIPRGTFICEYAGEVITQQQATARHRVNLAHARMNYIFCLNEFSNNAVTQMFVDPTNFGNIGRYVNHSCEPNSIIVPVRVDSPLPKLAIFSRVDIPSNSEITFDYGSLVCFSEGLENRKRCLCGSQNCRSFMPNEKY